MAGLDNFALLRNILRTLGLDPESADEVVSWVESLLAQERSGPLIEFPYHLRDNVLSPAERSFYRVLCQAVGDRALVWARVALGDLFYVKNSDYDLYRSYTNRIDREHVDFLLCQPGTLRPLVGVELDDGSHHRPGRREREAFVAQVFAVANLPLVRMPSRRAYDVDELRGVLLGAAAIPIRGTDPVPAGPNPEAAAPA